MIIKGSVVGRLLLDRRGRFGRRPGAVDLVFSHYNRKKGAAALRWVQTACAGKGRILGVALDGEFTPAGASAFSFPLVRERAGNAQVPAPALPVQWLVSCWHRQKETLTFEADLDGSPSFRLEVVRHRWCAHNRGSLFPQTGRPGVGCLRTRSGDPHHPHALEAGSFGGIERADVGAASRHPPGAFPSGVATVLGHSPAGSSGGSKRSHGLC